MKSPLAKNIFITLGFIVIWLSIILQFALVLKNHNYHWIKALDGFLMYFTVLTNITAGLSFGWILFLPRNKVGVFFSKPSTQTAITVYIVVVSLVYNLTLRGLINLTGLNVLANELLHVFIPIIVLLFWVLFVNKAYLKYSNTFSWLIYPFLYMIFALVRGLFTTTYPYPFINAIELGYKTITINCVILFFVFWLLSLFFVWLGRLKSTKKN